jgi:phosphoserine phosphatase
MLVVDLDGALLKSGMLHACFWSALSRDWRSPLRAARRLPQGKAALKNHLCRAARIDVSTLPYDAAVLAYIRGWRETGGGVALITATNKALAKQIADHLQLFDDVLGPDETTDLEGPAKAEFLVQRFGQGAFSYMGGTRADLPAWAASGKIITLNAPARLRRKTDAMGTPAQKGKKHLFTWHIHGF